VVQGVGGGGVDGTPPLGSCCVSIFRRDFAFGRKPLMCSTRRGIYFELGHCWGPVTSSNIGRHLGFYQKLEIIKKRRKLEIFNASHVKCEIIEYFAVFYVQFMIFFTSKRWKTHSLTQNWLDHLLLMTSYIVTIATDSHQTYPKMCLRDMPTATENGRCWWKIVLEKL